MSVDQRTGVTTVTMGPVDLIAPPPQPGGRTFRYGGAFPFQVAPPTAAVAVSLRNEGYPVGDFENGTDVILFEDPSRFGSGPVAPITRNEKYVHTQTKERRIVIKYPSIGGFVPMGALREDGSPHPHAGTGFALNEALDFPMKGNGYYSKADKTTTMVRKTEVHEFAFDGRNFRVVNTDLHEPESPLRAPGSDWALISPGLKQAIPDGDDFLYPIFGTKGDPARYSSRPSASGLSRWQRRDGRWRPVSFIPIADSTETAAAEPSLIRDTDGSLLFTARFAGNEMEDHVVRVWRSRDGGETWKLIIDLPQARGQAPVTINQAADGTPYIVGNKLGHERDWLCLWPLKADRAGLEEPITVRNALAEFGPPPSGPVWFMDHPSAATVRLADGKWHHLLSYRNMDRGEHRGADPTPQTGQYIEEVFSAGPAIPAWKFD